MDRDLQNEMDALRQEIEQIKEALHTLVSGPKPPRAEAKGKTGAEKPFFHPDDHLRDLWNDLEQTVNAEDGTGRVTYLGVFASGSHMSAWCQNKIDTDTLLGLVDSRMADRVLACIGSPERLSMLIALLRRPMTVAALVEACGLTSAGQAYHHLKPLIAANLVGENIHHDGKGVYAIVPDRVQGIIMLLAGLHDMTNDEHGGGVWEDEGEAE